MRGRRERALLERARAGDTDALAALRRLRVPAPRCPGELLAAAGATARERSAAAAHAARCRICAPG
ncbi:MAG: hypothetical protein Q8R60_01850 [Mycobacteriales bacterium]|nr:hypothetical protein [Mycobacteriales bacterium]